MRKLFSIGFGVILLSLLACKRQDYYQTPGDKNIDRNNPTINLNGSDTVTVYFGDTLIDPGATAYDAEGNWLSINSNTNINYNLMGYYHVNYIATDNYGKQSSIKRIIHLTANTESYLGNWNVNNDCRTNTLINMLDNNAAVTDFLNILTIDHGGQIITARFNGQNISIDPSTISVLTANSYVFTGSGRMADDGESFTIDYTYEGVGGLAGDGSCSATYSK